MVQVCSIPLVFSLNSLHHPLPRPFPHHHCHPQPLLSPQSLFTVVHPVACIAVNHEPVFPCPPILQRGPATHSAETANASLCTSKPALCLLEFYISIYHGIRLPTLIVVLQAVQSAYLLDVISSARAIKAPNTLSLGCPPDSLCTNMSPPNHTDTSGRPQLVLLVYCPGRHKHTVGCSLSEVSATSRDLVANLLVRG